jgi:hypothetical protein
VLKSYDSLRSVISLSNTALDLHVLGPAVAVVAVMVVDVAVSTRLIAVSSAVSVETVHVAVKTIPQMNPNVIVVMFLNFCMVVPLGSVDLTLKEITTSRMWYCLLRWVYNADYVLVFSSGVCGDWV